MRLLSGIGRCSIGALYRVYYSYLRLDKFCQELLLYYSCNSNPRCLFAMYDATCYSRTNGPWSNLIQRLFHKISSLTLTAAALVVMVVLVADLPPG